MENQPTALPIDHLTVADLLSSHTMPLAIKQDLALKPHHVVNRATFTLLEIGGRDFFLTSCHVLQKFKEIKHDNDNAQLVAYGFVPHFDEYHGFTLVDSEETVLDVAIFRGVAEKITIPGTRFIKYESSYLPEPQIGELVCVVGYPAADVSVKAEGSADFGYIQIIFPISSLSERQIVLANETGERRLHDFKNSAVTQIDLGGLSGSPAFVLRDMAAHFVGIVRSSTNSDHTILISRLGCLKNDGTLDRLRLPWPQ